MKIEELAKLLVVSAEVVGHELSRNAATAMALDLSEHSDADLVSALARCRREVKGRLSLSAIVERMPGQHPGADEAWALVSRGEDDTLVWTDEMSEAFGVARPLLLAGDAVGARMAFKDSYGRLTAGARHKPRWTVSLGTDPAGREPAIREAVAAGRLPAEHVERYLPSSSCDRSPMRLVTSGEPSRAGDALAALKLLKAKRRVK